MRLSAFRLLYIFAFFRPWLGEAGVADRKARHHPFFSLSPFSFALHVGKTRAHSCAARMGALVLGRLTWIALGIK
jgi:hypothetical protein